MFKADMRDMFKKMRRPIVRAIDDAFDGFEYRSALKSIAVFAAAAPCSTEDGTDETTASTYQRLYHKSEESGGESR